VAEIKNVLVPDIGNYKDVPVIEVAVKAGDSVSLVGFGTFSVGERAARAGRNPRTGKSLNIAAAKVPKFRPGKGLRDAL
jgi:DNA-binding protein HU-beta